MTTALARTRRKRTVKKKAVENDIIKEINVLLNKRFVEEDIIKGNLFSRVTSRNRKVITE